MRERLQRMNNTFLLQNLLVVPAFRTFRQYFETWKNRAHENVY